MTNFGDIVVIETDNARIICKDPENFFTEFENLISSEEEEWQSNKVKEGRKLTEIKFSNDHYLANLLATTKVLGISLERAKKLCRTVPGKRVEVNPPIEIISKSNTDKLFEELEEYEIEVSISIPSK